MGRQTRARNIQPVVGGVAVLAAVSVLTGTAACRESAVTAAPPEVSAREAIFVSFVSGDSPNVVVVDADRRQIVARAGPIPWYREGSAVAADTSALYVSTIDETGTRELLAIDTKTARIVWRQHLADIAPRGPITGLTLEAGVVATTPDGRRLLLARARRGDTLGLAAIDVQTRTPVAFVGPFAATAMATLLPTAAYPAGAVIVAATRTRDALPTTGALYLLDGATLVVRDSIPIVLTAGDLPGYLEQLLVSSDHRHLYVVGPAFLYAYDLVDRRVVASARRPSRGFLAITPDAGTIVVTDPGDGRDQPGSGLLYVYGPDLASRGIIDLRSSASVSGAPPRTVNAAASRDGRRLYVTAGSNTGGPLYAPQPGRVLIVDLLSGALAGVVALTDWGPGAVFVR